ncbi:Hypothetical protein CINCED_3A009812 [Cinara cedri]|nr:Hypothetical protein CINCED_3A009812 [Cinara cedri]
METTTEIEPFMKTGFKLLRRTKDPTSIRQMLKHLDDAIHEQYGVRRPANAAKKFAEPTTSLVSRDSGNDQTELIIDDDSSSSSSSSGPTSSKNIIDLCSSPPPTITLEQSKSDPVINLDSDSDMETDTIESYSCCACKGSNVNSGNSLVECLECHSMYHQNCHFPPITDINLNDPRIVWYCSNCRQKDTQKVSTKESRSSGKESKKSSSKNTGSKAEKSSSSKSSQSAKASPSKSKSSSANSSPKHYPPTSSTMMSAMEKRVQMMKKKAAKKTEKKK